MNENYRKIMKALNELIAADEAEVYVRILNDGPIDVLIENHTGVRIHNLTAFFLRQAVSEGRADLVRCNGWYRVERVHLP